MHAPLRCLAPLCLVLSCAGARTHAAEAQIATGNGQRVSAQVRLATFKVW